jgi:hypothetical protein
MSRIPRTALLALLVIALGLATASTAAARPWPGDPVPEPAPASGVVEQATTGTSPLWHFLLVAAVTSLVVGAAAYLAASRRPGRRQTTQAPSLEVGKVSVG